MSQKKLHPPIVDDNVLCRFVDDEPSKGYRTQQSGVNCFRFPIEEWSLWTYPQYYADTTSRELPGANLENIYASTIDWLQPCRGATCTQWGPNSKLGSFAFEFSGTGAKIYSNSAPFTALNTLQNYTVSVDGGSAQDMSTNDYLIFSVQDLSDENHTIEINDVGLGFTVDYAAVTPGAKYHRSDQQVFVDYTDDAVTFHGDWEDIPGGRSSSSVGSFVSLTFKGRVAFVLGMIENLVTGDFDLGFSLDGSAPIERTFSPNVSTDDAPAQLFAAAYRNGGVHNITATTLRLSGAQRFMFSGFSYTPDYLSVDEMPDLASPESTNPDTPNDSEPGGSSSNGAVIGGAVGGAVGGLLLIAALVFFFLRRRKRRQGELVATNESQEMPTPFQKDYVELSPISPVRRVPSTAYSGGGNLHPLSTAPAASILSSDYPNTPSTTGPSHAAFSEATYGSSAAGAGTTANGADGPRIDHIINLINTHYETLNQPPAYTAEQPGGSTRSGHT